MFKSLQKLTVNTLLIKGAPGASNSSHVKCLLSTVKLLKDFNITIFHFGIMKHKQASVHQMLFLKTFWNICHMNITWILIIHSPDLGLHLPAEDSWTRGGNPAEWSGREFKLPRRPPVTCFRSLLGPTVLKLTVKLLCDNQHLQQSV